MNAPLKVGILGSGRIAQGFDRPGDPLARTLAHAVVRSNRFQLGGFFDSDPDRARAGEQKWNCPAGPRRRNEWLRAGWDVIFIATPDSEHASDLEAALAARPRGVLVEKPLANDDAAAERLLLEARASRIPVLVDFPRRRHSGVRRIGQLLAEGALGAPRQIVAWFSGGLRHNGSHLLDLIAEWFPGQKRVTRRERAPGAAWLVLEIETGAVELFLAAAPPRDCYLFELHLFTDRTRVALSGDPEVLRLYRRDAHPVLREFPVLAPDQAWPIDEQPLFERTLEVLAQLIDDPERARAHVDNEIERQTFFSKVFELFES